MIGDNAQQRVETRLLEQWMHSDHLPRAILAESLALIWANGAAHRIFEAGTSLVLEDGRLACAESGSTPSLARFVRECDEQVRGFFLADETGSAFTVVRGRVIDASEGHRRLGLVFYEETAGFLRRYLDVADAFQLTAAEAQVVNQLLEGNTAEEITRRLSVSMATTRTHIRSIYRKLGVTSREALFARLQPFRL